MNINLKLIIPAQSAQLGMDFIPTIGQHGINLKNFCEDFNEITSNIYKGLPLRINIQIYTNKLYIINIKGIHLPYILNFYIKENLENRKKEINLMDLYKIYTIVLQTNKLFKIELQEIEILENLINKLFSYKINITK